MSGQPTQKSSTPFCVRLSAEERVRLEREAGEMPLGAYMKAKVFGGQEIRQRRTYRPIEDKEALAKALALLSQSRLASNLNQLAKAANCGSLPLCPEVETDLKEACANVAAMRALLITALGLQP